jgi:hypothetical protein
MNDIWTPCLQYPCNTCHADKGQGCLTRDGHPADIPHAPRLRLWERDSGQQQQAILRCRTCGLVVSGDTSGGECTRCRVVRELTAERYQVSPRHQKRGGTDGSPERS